MTKSSFFLFQDIFRFPPKKAEIIIEEVVKCHAKLGYDSSIFEQIKQGKYTEDDRTIEVLICANLNMGYGYENGMLDVEKTMTGLFSKNPEIRPMLEECDREGPTPVATLKAFLLCFRDKIPFKIRI
ncbi:hypothetical protein O3G_MSEX000714 [Manduca sexta]|nr:hypothetical protein O3G_MSEX000714 [Manduca sexta]KAG6439371.1 hypothetical protein O3G_MSEX000714 [Manduca sexta]